MSEYTFKALLNRKMDEYFCIEDEIEDMKQQMISEAENGKPLCKFINYRENCNELIDRFEKFLDDGDIKYEYNEDNDLLIVTWRWE